MKAIFALLALVVVASAMTDREAWTQFKNKYNKNYRIGAEKTRFSVFQQNLRNAEKLSIQNPSATYGITKFMDLTPTEFHARYTNLNVTEYSAWVNTLPKAKSPIRANPIDWRGKAVASVKDQGQCGSCWAFSAAAAMESCMMLKNGGQEVDVSAQQIVDCCTSGGSDGCNGGFPNLALQWACGQDMISWDAYPYNAEQGKCQKKFPSDDIAVPKGTCTYAKVGTTDAAQASALQTAPISIALAADVLQYYTGGIISGNDCKDTEVDHAVFLVAYTGSTYVIKNSWAEDWGEQGYFRVASGKCCLSMCGTSSQATPAK